MIAFTGLAGSSLVHALGWTLLHFCWQGGLVAGMLWCVLGLLGGRWSQARYCAACAAMLLMVALPLLTFGRIAVAEYHMRSAANRLGMRLDMSISLRAGVGEPTAPWPARIALAFDHSMPWLLAAWMVGALFFVARLNFGLVVAGRLRRTGIEPPSAELQQRFDTLRRRLGVARAVRLLHSARVQVPTVIGWLQPAVLIPVSCLTGLSTEQIEAIFCHELAHVRRHDYLVSVFQSLAEALLFYHPAVWWVSRQVRRERECCCDELAVANCGDALAYARALSYLEERRATLPEFVLGANGGVLTMRIRRLLGSADDAGAPQFAAFLLLAMVAAMSGAYMATVARAQKAVQSTRVAAVAPAGGSVDGQAQIAANGNAGRPPRGMYSNWLTEDVLWIITPQERDAYLRTTNDDERDAFITNFWKRRDAPGSPDGSYREEYYARMAYANEHFASDKRVGWRTDRGHVYLLYGKPDSIDSHPSGGQIEKPGGAVNLTYPFEVWHYFSIAGMGGDLDVMFVDTCRCGEYNYTVDGNGAFGASATDKWKAIESAPRIVTPTKVNFTVPRSGASSVRPANEGAGGVATVPLTVKRQLNIAEMPPPNDKPTVPGQQSGAPDMSCTYYDRAGGHTGTCEGVAGANDVYSCRANDDAHSSQAQSGCEWKVKRYLDWENQNHLDVSGGPVRVSAGVMQGNILQKFDPVYPAIAKAAHLSGTVVLSATISKLGTIERLQVVSGPPALVSSAWDAVKRWVYRPFIVNGEPTEVDTTINVNYTFGESAAQDTNASADGGSQLKKVGGDVSVPVVIYMPQPEYSPEARAAHFSGVVLLNLVVDRQGLPQDVRILRSVGLGLDAKALEAVKQYRFKPAMEDGKPVPVPLNVEVSFRAEDKPETVPYAAGAPGAASRVTLADGATAPVVTHSVEPEFTEQARKAKFMGAVVVNMIVDKHGRPQNVHVLRGIGFGLDSKAVEAVRQYRFTPAMKDGEPVEEALNIEVNFQIF
jgi:TonB family protein